MIDLDKMEEGVIAWNDTEKLALDRDEMEISCY